MTQVSSIWRVAAADRALQAEIAGQLGITPLVAQILINRGINSVEAADAFLNAGVERLHDPFALKGMAAAVERIRQALHTKEKIVIYGDYDVDGITASALLYRVLSQLGAAVAYYVPDRFSEGYGLNITALQNLCRAGADLIITVDCGITAVNEVAAIRGEADIIITDHHEPGAAVPAALAVINPKQPDCPYPEKALAGVGVAFKLCQALWQDAGRPVDELYKYLDLVAVGTVADLVPLVGENRIIVREGLNRLPATENAGLRALVAVCGFTDGRMDTGRIAFGLAPRLNAAGRVSHALSAVEMLITDDALFAGEVAKELDAANAERRRIEDAIRVQVEEMLAGTDLEANKVLVVAAEDWHHGVIGIVASRIVEKFYRPTLIISIENGVGRGSARSIRGFNIFEALCRSSDLLLRFGGHSAAAGFSILPENVDELRRRLNALAAEVLTPDDFRPVIQIDVPVMLRDITLPLLAELNRLAPYGFGNPAPVLACKNIQVLEARRIGADGSHLKLRVCHEGCPGEVVMWNRGDLADKIPVNSLIAVTFFPEVNTWQGRLSIQLRASDIKRQSAG